MKGKNMQNHAPETGAVLEIKALESDGRFAGYASVFDVIDSQRDRVRPGAFRSSLKNRTSPVQLLWQHQWENPLGVIDQLFEDDRGLYVEGRLLLEVARAREAYALLKAGAVRGLSIGYQVKQSRRDPESGVRDLLEVALWEISMVTLPANAEAGVTVVKHARGGDVHRLIAALDCAHRALRPGML